MSSGSVYPYTGEFPGQGERVEQILKAEREKRLDMAECFRNGVIREYRDEFCLEKWQEKVEKRTTRDIPENLDKMKALERCFGESKNLRVLSVGSGWGGFALAAAIQGHQAVGIDPDNEHIEVSRWRAKELGVVVDFKHGIGENIPYPDNSFDLVDCHSVLEHVQDVEKVLREMVRVLRPGGICHIDAPNYLYPAEAHYQVYRIPFAPKIVTKIYLKIVGKDTHVLDTLNFITPIKVASILKDIDAKDKHGISVQKITESNAMGDTAGKLPVKGAKTLTSKILRLCWNTLDGVYTAFGVNGSIHLLIRKRSMINE